MKETSVQQNPETSEALRSSRAGVQRGGTWLIVALMAGYSVVYMDKNMISTAIIPISKQFGLDTSKTGLIMSLFFLGYSVMQIPCGALADRFGAKRVLMTSLVVIGVFSYCFGAVGSFAGLGAAGSLAVFMAIRFFAGMGHGGYPPSCTKAVSENFVQSRRTFVQSLILSTSGIGGILAFTLGAQLISRNWQMAYVVLGSLYLVAFVLIAVFVPKDFDRAKAAHEEAKTAEAAGASTGQAAPLRFRDVITNRNVIVLFVAMLLLNVVLYGNMSWLPSYITSTFHLSVGQAGWILAGNSVFTTVATIFSGELLSKFFLGREKQAIVGSTLIVVVLVVAFAFSRNLVVAVVLMVCLSMLCTLAFTGIFTWPHKIMDAHVIGSSIGIINTGGTFGGFLAPMIIGALVKANGGSFTTGFLFLAACCVVTALVVLLIKVRR